MLHFSRDTRTSVGGGVEANPNKALSMLSPIRHSPKHCYEHFYRHCYKQSKGFPPPVTWAGIMWLSIYQGIALRYRYSDTFP